MMAVKTIVLDLDGPLLEGMWRHYQCYRDILAERSFKPIPMQQYWEMKRNRIDRRQLLALSNAGDLYDEFLAAWMARIETREYLALDRLQNHVVDILRDWKKSGIRLLLVTMRNNPDNLCGQLVELGITQYFDEVVVVGRAHACTNKAENIRLLLKDSRLEEIIWVGDTEVDIQAARELGIKVCALSCGLRSAEYLASLSPDMLEKDLNSFVTRRLKT
jgi:phosphoglycolate phosphatase